MTEFSPREIVSELDQWDTTPEPATIQRIIAAHKRFFASLRCTA